MKNWGWKCWMEILIKIRFFILGPGLFMLLSAHQRVYSSRGNYFPTLQCARIASGRLLWIKMRPARRYLMAINLALKLPAAHSICCVSRCTISYLSFWYYIPKLKWFTFTAAPWQLARRFVSRKIWWLVRVKNSTRGREKKLLYVRWIYLFLSFEFLRG